MRTTKWPAYWSGQSMATTVRGPEITLGPEGSLHAVISWVNTSAPIGTISLQFKRLDGSTWADVPGASAEFTANGNSQPNNDTKTIICHWRQLGVYSRLALLYTRSSGGSPNLTLNAEVTAS